MIIDRKIRFNRIIYDFSREATEMLLNEIQKSEKNTSVITKKVFCEGVFKIKRNNVKTWPFTTIDEVLIEYLICYVNSVEEYEKDINGIICPSVYTNSSFNDKKVNIVSCFHGENKHLFDLVNEVFTKLYDDELNNTYKKSLFELTPNDNDVK